jgi:hypothetical protein
VTEGWRERACAAPPPMAKSLLMRSGDKLFQVMWAAPQTTRGMRWGGGINRVGCEGGWCASADYKERNRGLQIREKGRAPNQVALPRADAVHCGNRLLHRHLHLTRKLSQYSQSKRLKRS